MVLRQPSPPEPVGGQASDLAVQTDELTRMRARLEELLARSTGRSVRRVRTDLEREQVLDAQEALTYGPIDRILPNRGATHTAPDAG